MRPGTHSSKSARWVHGLLLYSAALCKPFSYLPRVLCCRQTHCFLSPWPLSPLSHCSLILVCCPCSQPAPTLLPASTSKSCWFLSDMPVWNAISYTRMYQPAGYHHPFPVSQAAHPACTCVLQGFVLCLCTGLEALSRRVYISFSVSSVLAPHAGGARCTLVNE